MKLLSAKEAGTLLGVTRQTIYVWARAGVIQRITVGCRSRFDISALVAKQQAERNAKVVALLPMAGSSYQAYMASVQRLATKVAEAHGREAVMVILRRYGVERVGDLRDDQILSFRGALTRRCRRTHLPENQKRAQREAA